MTMRPNSLEKTPNLSHIFWLRHWFDSIFRFQWQTKNFKFIGERIGRSLELCHFCWLQPAWTAVEMGSNRATPVRLNGPLNGWATLIICRTDERLAWLLLFHCCINLWRLRSTSNTEPIAHFPASWRPIVHVYLHSAVEISLVDGWLKSSFHGIWPID